MSSTTVLVYGWYDKGNIGDELFKDAFQYLFPNYNFIFTDKLTVENLKTVNNVFIGGGSFLYADPKIHQDALEILKQKNIFYIGVGIENVIHPIHQELLKVSKFIAIRSSEALDYVQQINNQAILIPDIIYSLTSLKIDSEVKKKSILILPNFVVTPQWSDPNWKHVAWNYFKSEFSQFLDEMISSGHTINFFAMCKNNDINDNSAAIEIINQMKVRKNDYLISECPGHIGDLTKLISQYECIITQRFHGMVLSEISRRPYISIYHHDKLKSTSLNEGNFLSYYGFSKSKLFESLDQIKNKEFCKNLSINSNIFEYLTRKVTSLVEGG